MVGRILAGALALLTLLPFTAPLPAFDLDGLSHSHSSSTGRHSSTNLLVDGSCVHALPCFKPSPRIRLLALSVAKAPTRRSPVPSLAPVRIRSVAADDPPQHPLTALRI